MLAELIASEGVEEIHRRGLPFGVMAIHGGLEEGTAEIAEAVSTASGASLYVVVQPDNLRWHVPSTLFDPIHSQALGEFLESVEVAISIHGYGDADFESTALLGGSNRRLAQQTHHEFASRGIASVSDLGSIPKRLRGVHPANPVNRPAQGGVQIELPMDLRRGAAFHRVMDSLVAVVEGAAADLSGVARPG